MREFDFDKPYTILGIDGVNYYLQNGKRYLPKSKGPPQILTEFGAKRTEGGGSVMECLSCHLPFKNAWELGKHYKESAGCGEHVRKRRILSRKKSADRIEADRTLKKILGEQYDANRNG